MVIGVATAAGLLVAELSNTFTFDRDEAHMALAVLAACVGAAAVALGETAGRLTGNRRAEWVIPALALYCAVVVPSTVELPDRADPEMAAVDASSLVTFAGIVVLLLAAIRPPERFGSGVGWATAGGTALLAVALDLVRDARTGGALHLLLPVPVGAAVLALWCSVSSAVVVAGYCARSAPLWRVGLGFGVIATAHLYRAVWPQALTENGLVFATLRLLGTVVVLLGMAQLLRRVLTRVITERFTHEEDLRLASIRAEQLTRDAAWRDHELRNCLTGLSGLTTMLDDLEVDEPRAEARSAVRSELDRMSALLTRDHAGPVVGVYDAGRVVRELVALWRVAGLRIEAVVAADLTAVGSARGLAQVLTNLLSNCARHAPGSPVTVAARRADAVVRIQISDKGPQGARPQPGGTGIGLSLSRRLLDAEGGRLRVMPSDRPGFTVVVELATMHSPRCPADAAVSTHTGPR